MFSQMAKTFSQSAKELHRRTRTWGAVRLPGGPERRAMGSEAHAPTMAAFLDDVSYTMRDSGEGAKKIYFLGDVLGTALSRSVVS